MKRVKRLQAQAWLAPIRDCFAQIKTGYVDTVAGYPVARLHDQDDYARTDFCIAGFRGLIARAFPEIDTSPMLRVEKKLAAGTPLTIQEIDQCLGILNRCEDEMTGCPIRTLKDAVITEQIKIEIDQRNERNHQHG
jgi:hypothetical protein